MPRRTRHSPMTYTDAKRHAGRLTVRLARVWWDYLYDVAFDRFRDLADSIGKARRKEGDELEVEGPEAAFASLADAAEEAGRTRSAEELRRAVGEAKAASRAPKRKPEPETDAEAFKRIFEAGEVDDDIAAVAKARGLL